MNDQDVAIERILTRSQLESLLLGVREEKTRLARREIPHPAREYRRLMGLHVALPNGVHGHRSQIRQLFLVDRLEDRGDCLAGEVKLRIRQIPEPLRVLLEFVKNERVWVKVCGAERVSSAGPPFTDAVPYAQALIAAAPDRILWGTDWPHPNVKVMPNDGALVDLIPLIAPDAAIQRKILVENPQRLYWAD